MMIGSTDKTPMINWKRERKLKQWRRRDEGGRGGERGEGRRGGGKEGEEGRSEGRREGREKRRREGGKSERGKGEKRRERGGAQPTLTVDEPVVKIEKHCIIV